MEIAQIDEQAKPLADDENRIADVERVEEQQEAAADRKEPECDRHHTAADPLGGHPLRQGDVANVTMVARDAHGAKEFYEAVLQVPFSSGHRGAWRTEETTPPLGVLSSEGAEPEVRLSYRVGNIAEAVERVRAAGGRADEPERKPYGLLAECVDNQGATFHLWQPADRPNR